MNPHLKSDIYHLKSCIALTAESRICFAIAAGTRERGAVIAQIAVAAAMTEPTASLGGSSWASRMAVALFQRLLGGFPFVSAAALLP